MRAGYAGSTRLIGLFDIEFSENVLPARLPGQLLNVVLVGVDQVEKLQADSDGQRNIRSYCHHQCIQAYTIFIHHYF